MLLDAGRDPHAEQADRGGRGDGGGDDGGDGGGGAVSLDPLRFIAKYCLYSGAAGLAVGFVVLGILPFVEKAFKITTSMTLLELADASQPLLRRLAIEAPGTYNHSLQVATLAEAAAEAIGANSLLCRVAAYYHDVGKINKADYFIENQVDGRNRHINLSPSVSLLIIIGHVKDGMELAKEYNLPASILPFIQQHHGTTLIEYFYHQACTRQEKDDGGAERAGDAVSVCGAEAQEQGDCDPDDLRRGGIGGARDARAQREPDREPGARAGDEAAARWAV